MAGETLGLALTEHMTHHWVAQDLTFQCVEVSFGVTLGIARVGRTQTSCLWAEAAKTTGHLEACLTIRGGGLTPGLHRRPGHHSWSQAEDAVLSCYTADWLQEKVYT